MIPLALEEMPSSILKQNNFMDVGLYRRWILLAGTGNKVGTPEVDILAAKAIGKELATHRYGLITGGWHGVDYVVVLVQRELEASSFRLSSIL